MANSSISTYRQIQDWVLGQISKSDATTRNRVKTNINLANYDFTMREYWSFRPDETTTPDDLVGDSDEPDMPVEYRESLGQYALSLEHDFNTDPDLAQKAMNRYEQILNNARQSLLVRTIEDAGLNQIYGPQDFTNWTDISDGTTL